MFQLQKISQYVTLAPDMTVAEYERELHREGFTGGFRPVEGYQVSLWDCLAHRYSNMYFMKYGGIEDLCIGGRVKTKAGRSLDLKKVPRAATGPDLRRVILGAQGLVGNFFEVSLKIFPVPEHERWGLIFFNDEIFPVLGLKKIIGQFIRPVFAKFLSPKEGLGLLRSLNLPEHESPALAVKLSGLKGMVEAERETIEQFFESALLYWPTRPQEVEVLNETLITADTYAQLIEKTAPLFGTGARMTHAESKFVQFLKETVC